MRKGSFVVSAEAESVAHCGAHGALLCLIEREVEVVVYLLVLVGVVVVDGGRYDVVLYRQHAHHCLYGSGGTEQVAGHRLGRADVQLVGCVAEDVLYGLGFGYVAYVRRRAVYVDVVYVLRLQAGVVEGGLHYELGSESVGVRRRDVVCVGALAFANHFGVYLRAARLGVLKFLEDEASCSLGHHEAVAACAERARGFRGLVVARREGVHGVESAHAACADGCLGSSADYCVGLTQADEVERVGYGVGR